MKKKLLIIEDDENSMEVLELIALESGVDVICSRQLLLIEDIISIVPDVILLDLLIQSGKGGKLCYEIKGNIKTDHIVVISISAHHVIGYVAKESCIDDYISKPFNPDDFNATLKKYL